MGYSPNNYKYNTMDSQQYSLSVWTIRLFNLKKRFLASFSINNISQNCSYITIIHNLVMVKAIPDGYHSITPYLVVNDAAAAIEFYKRAFGAKETYRHPTPDGKSIVNAELKIGDSIVLLSDEFPHGESRSPHSIGGTAVTLHINTEDVDKAFNQAVNAGATIVMPVMDMFWGDRYGQLKDPFGHIWSIATHNQDLSQEEIQKAGESVLREMMGSQSTQ